MKANRLNYRSIFSFLLTFVCIATFAQWPQWRGPQRDGVSKETNLLKSWPVNGPKLLWSVNTVGDGFSSVAMQDGIAVTLGKRDSVEILTALDANGNIKWQKELGPASKDKEWPQSRSTPTIVGDKVYSVTVVGDVACVDLKSGNINWKLRAFEQFNGAGYATDGLAESPLIVDDKIIITPCGKTTTMVALNRFTGEVVWKSESVNDTSKFTSPVLFTVNQKSAIFTSNQFNDILVDVNTGKILWKDSSLSCFVPVVNGNQIFFPNSPRKAALYSWDNDLTKRSVVWQDTAVVNGLGGAVLYKNKFYVSGGSRGIICLDAQTGKTLSVFNDINRCNLMVADDMLYAYEDKIGKVCLFRFAGDKIELVSSFKVTEGNGPRIAYMAVANGMLFIRRGNTLFAYNIKNS
jgi:outer membrane protein assembly factor BamB